MNDDLIKRSDAIKAINAETNWYQVTCNGKQIAVMLMAKDVNETLEKVPSADRPQGEWILLEPRYPIEQKVYWNKEQALADTKGNGARERRKCSCCGYTKSFMCHMKDEQIKLWNFCPNCGARMKGAV